MGTIVFEHTCQPKLIEEFSDRLPVAANHARYVFMREIVVEHIRLTRPGFFFDPLFQKQPQARPDILEHQVGVPILELPKTQSNQFGVSDAQGRMLPYHLFKI
jgi:hypothetical protein